MSKPVLLTVDDDPAVLRAVERDLRRKYSADYRVLRADSGATALELLKHVQQRRETVALLLVDQRMPGMSGVEFLTEALPLFPRSKRALLTAYADTAAAIDSINKAQIDYYLMKPWDPPEERLYPVLDDLLEDWRADFRPPFEGIRVIGLKWSPASHAAKDFLARNQVPYQWLDLESDDEAKRLAGELGATAREKLPIVVFPDGSHLASPQPAELAARVGLRTHAGREFYDVVIIGGGPSGLAAAVYGASEGLKTLVVEKTAPGGQAGSSSRIENYLGFPSGLSGADLARRAVDQARRFGVEFVTPQHVEKIRAEETYRILTLGDGAGEISCHAALISTGVAWRKLNLPGIEQLTGAGVYYGAAATEALSCQDRDVFIVGGANSAGQAAMYLSRFAKCVNMLVRGDSLAKSMSSYLIDQINTTPNIAVHTRSRVVEVQGGQQLEAITVARGSDGEAQTQTVPAVALFVFIGAEPCTDFLDGFVERDEHGFVLTGPELIRGGRRPRGWTLERDPFLLETSVSGVFAAGDVRKGSIKRVASAVGEGSIAIELIHDYLGTYAP